MLDGHGDDLHKYANIEYNFSSNVYYGSAHPKLIEHLKQNVHNASSQYPPPNAEELIEVAAKFHQIESNRILFYNGAAESFYAIARLWEAKNAIVFGPTFAEYADACRSYNLNVETVSLSNFSVHSTPADLAFLCNPNNPDGTVHSVRSIKEFLQRNTKTSLVVDEAYIGFTTSTTTALELLRDFERLIIVKSLTKEFCIPGLRLGYVVSSPKIIDSLTEHKIPWSVNGLAIEAGKFIFQHYHEIGFDIAFILEETKEFAKALNQIEHLDVQPSNTTYLLAKLKLGKARLLKEFLAIEHKILIRDASNFETINCEAIRISLQDKEANSALINALKKWKPT